MSFQITITDAGRAALINAENDGTTPVLLSDVGLSNESFTPNKSMTSLPGQIKRLETISGEVQSAHTLHVTVRDESDEIYTVHGFGLFLEDGTLFGIYSQSSPMLVKAEQTILLMALDITIESLDVTALAFGDTTFTNPPATTERAGVVELATPTETQAGADATRAITPAALASRTSTTSRTGLVQLATATEVKTGSNATKAVTPAALSGRTITAGNGLTGGGDLGSDRALALGVPSTLTVETDNAATSESHTHKVNFPVTSVAGKGGDVALALADIGGLQNALNDKSPTSHGHAEVTASAAGFMSSADKAKLNAVAAGATKNATDAQLRDRGTHTGTQAISTIVGLQSALDSKSPSSHSHSGATTSVAGFMSAADKAKLNAIASGATKNATDAQLRDRGTHTGSQAISTVTGLQAALDAKSPTLPRGIIVMWSGAINAVPTGWALCDGANGTPNLRNRFIVGAGSTYAAGATGGATSATTNSAGAHTHPVTVTVSNHTLSAAQMPAHRHKTGITSTPGQTNEVAAYLGEGYVSGSASHRVSSTNSTSDPIAGVTETIGSGSSHSHSASGSSSSAGAHTHTVNTLPPYYALAYIMKL